MFSRMFRNCHGRRHARGEDRERHHGRHGFHHLRGGRGRVFDHGDLRFVILRLIADKPRHGYELIKDIEDRLAGSYSPSPGIIYPTLTLLEELGYASVSPFGDGKKLYAITPEGQAALAAHQPTVDAIFARIAEIKAAHGGGPSPQIVQAMNNLRQTLRQRLARGPLDEAQIAAIGAALDEAAANVEKS